MALITDIPERDGEDGATQLTYLRSYLKDTDSGNYKYTDQFLIDLLVDSDRVAIWRALTGHPDGIPWRYSTKLPLDYESLVRVHTGDTNEADLSYTNYEINYFLETIPLRYVVSCILLKEAQSATYPSDKDHPLHILRKYLNDTDINSAKNTDDVLVDMLFYSGKDPYSFVADILRSKIGSGINETTSTESNLLASIDGISFEDQSERVEDLEKNIDFIAAQGAHSVYARPVYGYYVGGESQLDINWEDYWYGL